jgi:tRNA 2-thiouridine synthesizing protein C
MKWIGELLAASSATHTEQGTIKIFLTGDALFSLVDARTRPAWVALSSLPRVQVIADGDELRLQGLWGPVSSGTPGIRVTGKGGPAPFWGELVSVLKDEWTGTKAAAFLLCNSPYMSRIPLYMLRFLNRVVEAGLHPELYCYLDGVHVLHDGQRPSEFENIGRGISALSGTAVRSCRDPWFAACSRCATARGYYQMNPGTGFCEPASCIQDIAIMPLKQILSRFPGSHPIVSHMSGETVSTGEEMHGVPHLAVFITNSPYCSEWTFGGLSLAIAAAMDGIPTNIIFIEDGVYALHGTHEVPENDRIFNVEEMIAVTADVEGLSYLVHAPSLTERGICIGKDCPPARAVTNRELSGILFPTGDIPVAAPAIRMLFF